MSRFFRPPRWAAALLLAAAPALAAIPLRERLTEESLRAVRQDARALRQAAAPSPRSGEWLDVRCIFHAHSALSHDSPGTEAEIVAAARAAGVRAVFMTEHPTPDRRWFTEGLRGEKEGVLFVPGAELSDGLLVWRSDGTNWSPDQPAREVLQRLQGTEAVAVIAHPEQRKESDWDLPPFVGMEIYNSHADAEDNGLDELLASLRRENPLQVLALLNTLKQYPREAFAAIFDEPKSLLAQWDRLNAAFLAAGPQGGRRVVGIAGNDSHRNVGLTLESAERGIVARDALGRVLGEIPKKQVPFLLFGDAPPGGILFQHTFDPYEISFGYVSTHLLAEEVSEGALFEALRRGRAYVAFDWMADPSGFRFAAEAGGRTIEMGGDAPLSERPRLVARTTMPCRLRLLRNGEEVLRAEGAELSFEPREPGVYRVEAWVRIGRPGGAAAEATAPAAMRPWIYSNPIYVR